MPRGVVRCRVGGTGGCIRGVLGDQREEEFEEAAEWEIVHYDFLLCLSLACHRFQSRLVLSSGLVFFLIVISFFLIMFIFLHLLLFFFLDDVRVGNVLLERR